MIFQDYLLDENGDLLIENGDFVVGASDEQHAIDIMQSFPGEWKQFPLLGAGLIASLKTDNPQAEKNNIFEQLQSDGFEVNSMKIGLDANGNLKIQFPTGGLQRNA